MIFGVADPLGQKPETADFFFFSSHPGETVVGWILRFSASQVPRVRHSHMSQGLQGFRSQTKAFKQVCRVSKRLYEQRAMCKTLCRIFIVAMPNDRGLRVCLHGRWRLEIDRQMDGWIDRWMDGSMER